MQITRAEPSAATLAFAAEVGTEGTVAVEGGRTHWHLGGPLVEGTRLVHAPVGVVAFEPDEMVVRCGAGTTVAELDATLRAKGQQCPLDPSAPERATVGGVLAAGVSGHRRLRYGPTRDLVLEAQYVAADGAVIRAGAPVVKNVSGFDLNKLLVGSFGSLGLLAEVVLRCRPLTSVSSWLRFDGVDPWALRASLFAPSSILWDGTQVWVLLEGDAADVGAERQGLRAFGGGTEVDGPPPLPAGGRVSMASAQVRNIPSPDAERAAAWGRWVAEVGVGTVHVEHPQPLPPLPNRQLQLDLKRAYDPDHRFSPGRFPW